MNLEGKTRGFSRRKDFIVGATLLTSLLALPSFARLQSPGNSASPGSSLEAPKQSPAHVEKSPEKGNLLIPIGTLLPVRLNTTISSAKNKRGKEITDRIMQGVPLSPAEKIPAGSKVLGHIVEVSPASAGQGGRVTLKFDKLIAAHRTIPITTNLRAIAGFMRVLEAQIPPVGPSESDVYDWLTFKLAATSCTAKAESLLPPMTRIKLWEKRFTAEFSERLLPEKAENAAVPSAAMTSLRPCGCSRMMPAERTVWSMSRSRTQGGPNLWA